MIRKRNRTVDVDDQEISAVANSTNIQSKRYDGNKLKRSKNTNMGAGLKFIMVVLLLAIGYYFVGMVQYRHSQARNTFSSPPGRDKCGCFPHDGTGGKIAYLISLHNQRTLDESVHLLKSISAPVNIIFIHMDMKLPIEEYENSDLHQFINGECNACGSTVIVEQKFDLEWGQWSMNAPTHWCMEQLVSSKYANQWDVFINLSADSLNVYTPQIISNMFDPNKKDSLYGTNFVTSSPCVTGLMPTGIKTFPRVWHKRKHYETGGEYIIKFIDDDGAEKTEEVEIHFGSQWMFLTPKFVKYLVSSLQNPNSLASRFKEEMIYRKVLMTDETFIPSLLYHDQEHRQTLPKPNSEGYAQVQGHELKSVRYERMDENMPNAFGEVVKEQRYDVPESAINVDVPRAWGPYYLGIYDLGAIKDSGALFIRKVSRTIDDNLFKFLPVTHVNDIPNIRWPREVKVSKLQDWGELQSIIRKLQ